MLGLNIHDIVITSISKKKGSIKYEKNFHTHHYRHQKIQSMYIIKVYKSIIYQHCSENIFWCLNFFPLSPLFSSVYVCPSNNYLLTIIFSTYSFVCMCLWNSTKKVHCNQKKRNWKNLQRKKNHRHRQNNNKTAVER